MEPWLFSDQNLHLLNSIIELNCPQNEIQNHLQTLFRNNLNSPGNINDTTNFTTVINISNDDEDKEEEMDDNEVKVEVVEEQIIDSSDDFKFLLNENGLLTENAFLQIIKSNKMDKVFMFLEHNFSSEELCKFCLFLASLENIENDILKSFCTKILYPKFMNSSINTSLQNAIQKLFINFENILCENLLIKLMDEKLNLNLQVLIVICDQLTANNKYTALSKLLNSSEKLDEERIELIQTLFENDTADENLKLRLIHLLYDSADLFSTSLIYGKLLLTILKSLKAADTQLSDTQYSLLQSIVAQNKSIYKRAAEKIIKNINK